WFWLTLAACRLSIAKPNAWSAWSPARICFVSAPPQSRPKRAVPPISAGAPRRRPSRGCRKRRRLWPPTEGHLFLLVEQRAGTQDAPGRFVQFKRGPMIKTVEAPDGFYRFMPGVSQYSCGVAALPGFAIERVRFADPVPLKAGFARIADI